MDKDLNASHREATDSAVAVSASHTDIPSETDVLIVGFGPVGATIANLLGSYGVRTLVVDKATEIFMAPRAIALDNEALRILQTRRSAKTRSNDRDSVRAHALAVFRRVRAHQQRRRHRRPSRSS